MKSLKSCPTLCDPMDCTLPGFSIHGILQARILEWVAISFSRGSSPPRDRTWVSRIAGRCFTVWAAREAIFSLLLTKFAFQIFLPFLLLLSVGEESCVGLWPWIAKYGQLCLSLCNPVDSNHQAPLSMRFLRQGDWSGLSFPTPGHLPYPGIELCLLHLLRGQADLCHLGSPYWQWGALCCCVSFLGPQWHSIMSWVATMGGLKQIIFLQLWRLEVQN